MKQIRIGLAGIVLTVSALTFMSTPASAARGTKCSDDNNGLKATGGYCPNIGAKFYFGRAQ